MKKILFLMSLVALILQGCGSGSKNKAIDKTNVSDLSGTIIINGSEVLYPLADLWQHEFNKQFPKILIKNRPTGSDNSLKILELGQIQLAMVSRNLTEAEKKDGLYAVPVAVDVVLPVINFENNYIQPITMHGVSPEKLTGVFNGNIKTWGQLLDTKAPEAIETLILPDSCGTGHTWADFLQTEVKKIKGSSVYDNLAMVNTIAAKKFSLGYCSISRIFDPKTGMKRANIYVMPIDFNANGQADDNELVLDKMEDIKSAVQAGKYPAPPVRTLYLVAKNLPKDAAIKAFLNWVVGLGQNFCAQSGLINIDKATSDKFLKELK